ncbi:hypothetical protein ABS71_21145 [bacterium SCN 62-11]|nr:hypothetical protein [Candidatus Eremiobacteraeota bacterium]ODT56880.1 MAG: hypothetical protein ABS71_21145 [bacterium SCN 62-11]
MRIQAQTQPLKSAPHALSLQPARQRLLTPEGEALTFPTDGTSFFLGSDVNRLVGPEDASPGQAEAHWRDGTLWLRGENALANGLPCADWTPLGDGGRIQLGDSEQPALSLAVLGDQPAGASKQTVALTYFGDATEPKISRGVSNQPGRLAKLLADSPAPVQVQGVLLRGGRIHHLAQAALPASMAAVGVAGLGACVAGLVQGVNTPLLVLGGLTALGGGLAAAANWKSMPAHWKAATQKLDLSGIPSQRVQVRSLNSAPSAQKFDEAWKTSLSSWPQARQVLFLSGHGYQNRAAGIHFEHIGKTVRGAEAIVLDACNGGQVEALLKLADSARVAVCSEHTVRSSGFPLEAMFGQTEFPQDSRALATSLVQSASGACPAESLVAVDLEALKGKLLPSMEKLARHLKAADKGEIKEALSHSETTDTAGKTTVDLGSFLAQLPQTAEVEATQQALNDTVLAMVGHGTLSFDRYSPPHMPESWRSLMNHLRG